ncbi:MAG TPA: delta-60 repeat domain-containing protein [Rudaea sp.]|nr:delta-60 repeat domain-containing protein [Rudaea sp.]
MRFLNQMLPMCALLLASSSASAFDGDLDLTFGSAGQQLLTVDPFNQPIGATLAGNDVVVQPDGKIVIAGYAAGSLSEWVVIRLNSDGSYDHSFGIAGNGIVYFYEGNVDNQAVAVALRPDGHIVVGGTILDSNNGLVTAVAIQLNSDGSSDTAWGSNGQVYFTPPAGAGTRTRAIVLDTVDPYALGSLYLVGQYTDSAGHNNFFYGGISADGHTTVSNAFQASVNPNVSESATSVAVQPGTGNVIVGGYAANAIGEVHCAAISTVIIPNPAFSQAYLYTSWGSGGSTSVYFSMATHNNDYCDAMTVTADGFMMLGGHGSTTNGSKNYDSGIMAFFDNNGTLLTTTRSGLTYPYTYAFTYDGSSDNGDFNTINKLVLDRYDTKSPTFMAVGYGFDSVFFPGTTDDFGVGRLLGSDGFLGIYPDISFRGGLSSNQGFSMIAYSVCGEVSCSSTNNAYAKSAVFDAQGRLVVVGYASDPRGGTDIALARLKQFDGIFKNGFDFPSY